MAFRQAPKGAKGHRTRQLNEPSDPSSGPFVPFDPLGGLVLLWIPSGAADGLRCHVPRAVAAQGREDWGS